MSFKRHGRTGILVALLFVLFGLPAVWIKGKSYYVAEAVFQVWPNYQKNLSADKELEFQSNSQYREFVNHLSRSVLRYDVLQHALALLDKAGVNPRLPAEDDRKCIERLQRAVYVFAIADTYMVRVGLQSDKSGEADKVVNAIMDAFLETTRAEQIYGSEERSKVLEDQSRTVRDEIAGLEQKRVQLAGKLGLTTFGENTSNPYDTLLAQAREKLALATIERSQAQAALDAFESQHEAPVSAGGRSVLDMRLQDNGLQALRNEVVKRSEELNRTVAGLEPRHPAYNAAVVEEKYINERLLSRENAFEKMAAQNVRSRLVASLLQTRHVEKELSERVSALSAETMVFASNFREAVRATSEIRKREQELDEMRNRANFLKTERNAIGFVRLITPALPADAPQGLGKTRLLLMLLAAGIALTLIVPVLIDMLDRRIRVVGDAERAMGIASAGWVVRVDDDASRILARDQSRRFASTLMRNQNRGAKGVFGFTSVKVGGGATAVVLDVARTLKELGSNVLVVDANSLTLSSPMADAGPGVTDLLAGRASAHDIVREQTHAGQTLSVVPFGQARESGIQRLDILKAALVEWSATYPMVLVDIAPILPSADAELVIDAIGQVFLIVEANSVTKGDVVRARNALQKLAPDAVGLIVNKVALEDGGNELTSQLVETITGGRFQTFMSTSSVGLRIEAMRTRLKRMFWLRKG
jgi:Mrp family chromosome partitioning ATPase/uncharacterized protein involved in exopolysaccharide biosynthesis